MRSILNPIWDPPPLLSIFISILYHIHIPSDQSQYIQFPYLTSCSKWVGETDYRNITLQLVRDQICSLGLCLIMQDWEQLSRLSVACWYSMVLMRGIAGYFSALYGIAWYSMVLHGTVKYCIELYSIAWYRLVTANTPITSQLLGPQPRSASYNRGGKSQKTDRQNKPRQIES